MSDIRLKRGNKADLPLLAIGEPAFTLDTKEFYVGSADGNIQLSTMNGVGVKNYSFAGTFDTPTSSKQIELPIYQPGDSVMVYIGGLLKTKDVNYTLDNATGTVIKIDDGTGTTWPTGYTYDFVVLKNVDELDPSDPWIDGGTF